MQLEAHDYIQFINLFYTIIGFSYTVYWIRHHKEYKYLGLPILTLVSHYLLFYTMAVLATVAGFTSLGKMLTFIFNDGPLMGETWSSILRLHGIIIAPSILFIAGYCIRGVKWIQQQR
jgi:hypothetical protein